MPKGLLYSRKDLLATENEGDAFAFCFSSLPWKKRDQKGKTMLKQPGHLNYQLSLAPPNSSYVQNIGPPLLEKQSILCFKAAPP